MSTGATGLENFYEDKDKKKETTNMSAVWCSLIGTHQAIRAYPTVMSKMLLPIELDTAMSPMPLRATITLVTM